MKKYCLFILVIAFLSGCKGGDKNEMSREDRLKEIKKKETIVRDSYETGVIDSKTAESLRKDYLAYASDFPEDSLAPKYLHKASEVALELNMEQEAIKSLDVLLKKYPKYKYLPVALYYKGFILENHLKDIPAAVKVYEDFLKKYPNHELAPQVQATLLNIGKSPDQLVDEFMARTNTPDSL